MKKQVYLEIQEIQSHIGGYNHTYKYVFTSNEAIDVNNLEHFEITPDEPKSKRRELNDC